MPRVAREKSETGIYHIMMRGVDKRDIFINEEDYKRFLFYIVKAKKKSNFSLLSYCLMTNHVHLLLKEGNEEIGESIRRISVGYAQYHNTRHNRIGHLFQNRFRSEPINNDSYLLTVLRYIHQNPLKAGIINSGCDYEWSSYGLYLKPNNSIIERDIILGYFVNVLDFVKFNNEASNDICLEYGEKKKYTDVELKKIIEELIDIKIISGQNIEKRNQALKQIKDVTGASIRQLERVLNIGRSIILKA